jgi:uncharacterized protein YbcI
VDPSSARGDDRHGEALAQITTEIVRLYSEYYGRGPTRRATSSRTPTSSLSYAPRSRPWSARWPTPGTVIRCGAVRLTFQEALAEAFKAVVEEALSRHVVSYHSQLLIDADIGFEMFVLD